MKIPAADAIHLLHESAHACLSTHSLRVPGFPFGSVVNFMPDRRHDPVFLISGLAEHTRNLAADGRASLMVLPAGGGDVLTASRLTLLGEVEVLETTPALAARYLRYHPDADRYLQLGDFRFHRLRVAKARFVAGFGAMGWLESEAWHEGADLGRETEAAVLAALASAAPAGLQVLGLDALGMDIRRGDRRQRLVFAQPATDAVTLEQEARASLAALA